MKSSGRKQVIMTWCFMLLGVAVFPFWIGTAQEMEAPVDLIGRNRERIEDCRRGLEVLTVIQFDLKKTKVLQVLQVLGLNETWEPSILWPTGMYDASHSSTPPKSATRINQRQQAVRRPGNSSPSITMSR